MLQMPSLLITDYEHAKFPPLMQPTWTLVPEIIPDHTIRCKKGFLKKYPGIKEDVYVPIFKPEPAILHELGLNGQIVVTLRPPATEAHYHNPESEKLFATVMRLLGSTDNVRTVLLPRNNRQTEWIRSTWPECLENGKMVIPNGAIDGLNLLWYSDLVISGGGTMNREAAALGIPAYSIFRGRLGAVDEYLAQNGRLILLVSEEDVKTKIRFARRSRNAPLRVANVLTLRSIIDNIIDILEHGPKRHSLWCKKHFS
jgi:predicted glycosyltransferase